MEHAAADAISCDHPQPDLDLVEPGGIGGGEMKRHLGVLFRPGLNGGSFVNCEVIQDHMDGLASMSGYGFIQEAYELLAGVAWHAPSYHLPAVHLQSGKQRDGSVPHVLDGLPFRPLGSQWQRRLCAVQCLDRSLLVDAENCCVLRGMQ